MIKIEELKNYFLCQAPVYYNKNALSALFHHILSGHIDTSNRDLFLSKVIAFKRVPEVKIREKMNAWYSLFAEMHSWYLINNIVKTAALDTEIDPDASGLFFLAG